MALALALEERLAARRTGAARNGFQGRADVSLTRVSSSSGARESIPHLRVPCWNGLA